MNSLNFREHGAEKSLRSWRNRSWPLRRYCSRRKVLQSHPADIAPKTIILFIVDEMVTASRRLGATCWPPRAVFDGVPDMITFARRNVGLPSRSCMVVRTGFWRTFAASNPSRSDVCPRLTYSKPSDWCAVALKNLDIPKIFASTILAKITPYFTRNEISLKSSNWSARSLHGA